LKRVRAYGGEVRISGLKDQPLAIFKLLQLDKVFPGSRG
jgi:anti-sigma B factor antagonist